MKLVVELTDDLYARIMRNSREPYYDVAMVIKNGVPLEPEPKTMTEKEAIERIQSIKSKVSLYYDVLALRMAEEALETCDLMSKGIPYIVHNGRIYKLTDEKGE